MTRINIHKQTIDDEWVLDGWFDIDKAETWTGDDYSAGRRIDLLRTAQRQWLLGYMTQWQGETPRFERITPDQAHTWLIKDGDHEEDVQRFFGDLEEERGPGRPTEGTRIDVRLPEELLTRVDVRRESGESRASTIRRLLEGALS